MKLRIFLICVACYISLALGMKSSNSGKGIAIANDRRLFSQGLRILFSPFRQIKRVLAKISNTKFIKKICPKCSSAFSENTSPVTNKKSIEVRSETKPLTAKPLNSEELNEKKIVIELPQPSPNPDTKVILPTTNVINEISKPSIFDTQKVPTLSSVIDYTSESFAKYSENSKQDMTFGPFKISPVLYFVISLAILFSSMSLMIKQVKKGNEIIEKIKALTAEEKARVDALEASQSSPTLVEDLTADYYNESNKSNVSSSNDVSSKVTDYESDMDSPTERTDKAYEDSVENYRNSNANNETELKSTYLENKNNPMSIKRSESIDEDVMADYINRNFDILFLNSLLESPANRQKLPYVEEAIHNLPDDYTYEDSPHRADNDQIGIPADYTDNDHDLYETYEQRDNQNDKPQRYYSQDTYDPTMYYTEFWQYAAQYGEDEARKHYGEWAPPLGSLPPLSTDFQMSNSIYDANQFPGSTPQTPDPSQEPFHEFWIYVVYYGEELAREYYMDKTPPIGTPMPDGYWEYYHKYASEQEQYPVLEFGSPVSETDGDLNEMRVT